MKRLRTLRMSLLCMALLCAPVLSAQPAASPLLGTWSLDTSRMPVPAEQRPKHVSFSFADAGGGKWSVHVDIVYAPGQEVHSVATPSLDGTSAVVENSPEADHVQLKVPAPNVVVLALMKGDVLASTRIYSVMPDGRTLVETNVYPGEKGVAVMKLNYFQRAR
ncbi:MAG: hypothetical protein ABWZ85_05800 [Luteibacter sp.]